jgi:Ca2+-binding RTX toxin-like protein
LAVSIGGLIDSLEANAAKDKIDGKAGDDTTVGDHLTGIVGATGALSASLSQVHLGVLVTRAKLSAAADSGNGGDGADYIEGDSDTRVLRTFELPHTLAIDSGALVGTLEVKAASDSISGGGGTNMVEQGNGLDAAKGLVKSVKVSGATTHVAPNLPVIDWAAPLREPLGGSVASVSAWTQDFVVSLGQNEDERNPNAELRVRIP